MSVKARGSVAAVALIIGALAGCHSTPKASDRYDSNGAQGAVAVMANDTVILDPPTIKIERGVTYIAGTVHRHPRISGEIAGRVDIEFLGPEGEYLDGLPALLTPRTVPTDPNASATYSTSYGYVPPAGSTIRVHFIDHETQIEEDLSGNDYGYGGGGGAGGAGGGGHGGKTPNGNPTHSAGSHTGGGGFGSGFGGHGGASGMRW